MYFVYFSFSSLSLSYCTLIDNTCILKASAERAPTQLPSFSRKIAGSDQTRPSPGPSAAGGGSIYARQMADLQSKLQAAEELVAARPAEAIPALKDVVVGPHPNDAESLKVKEKALDVLASALLTQHDAGGLRALLTDLRPLFAAIPKAKTAKIVRTVIDSIAKVPESTKLLVSAPPSPRVDPCLPPTPPAPLTSSAPLWAPRRAAGGVQRAIRVGHLREAHLPAAAHRPAPGGALPGHPRLPGRAGADRHAAHRGEAAGRQAAAGGDPPAGEQDAQRAAQPAQVAGRADRGAHRRQRHLHPALAPGRHRHPVGHAARRGEGLQDRLLLLLRGL